MNGLRDEQGDAAEGHLDTLLALLAASAGADEAFLLTPRSDGDVLARSSKGRRRLLPFCLDDGDGASPFGQGDDDGRALHPDLVASFGAFPAQVLTVPLFESGRRVAVLQLATLGTGDFLAPASRSAASFAPSLASALACADAIESARQELSQHDDMLRSLTDGVIAISLTGDITHCNEAACAMLRLAPPAVGRSVARVFGPMNGWLLEAMDQVAGAREVLHLANTEIFLEHDGCWVALDVALLPVQGSRGELNGMLLLLRSLAREKALRRAVSRYVSPKVLDTMLDEQDSRCEGRQQLATVLFSDIRGFTSLSERIGPAATVQMLNEYFSFMEDVVTNHGGAIDKYIGDAVMAVFGLPHPQEHDAGDAVRAAVDMIRALGILNARRSAEGQAPIRIGIGLATGPVIAGSIGSANRMDFTVIGDAVNLASRIESLTKAYGADILLDGVTAARLSEGHAVRRLDRIRVLGQRQPTDIHEVATGKDERQGEDWRTEYEAALDPYLRGDWIAAHDAFEAILARRPLDGAARLMRSRCLANRVDPPRRWNGVTDLASK